jgi:hypothetical protein
VQQRIGHTPTRPVGRPSNEARRSYAGFSCRVGGAGRSRVGSSPKACPAKAGVEWHVGELYPRVGFIVTNMSRPPRTSSLSTTSAEPANNGSRRARARSNGRGCRAAPSRPTPFALSFTRSPQPRQFFGARWPRPNRSRTGR